MILKNKQVLLDLKATSILKDKYFYCLENANFKKVTFAKDLSMRRVSNMQLKRHQMCDRNFIE